MTFAPAGAMAPSAEFLLFVVVFLQNKIVSTE